MKKKLLWKWITGVVSVRGLMCVLFLSSVSLAGCGLPLDDLLDEDEIEQVDPDPDEDEELEED